MATNATSIDGNINCIGPYKTYRQRLRWIPSLFDCDDTKQKIIFDVNDIDCDGIPSMWSNDYDSMDIDCAAFTSSKTG